jgi:hypothetical protein
VFAEVRRVLADDGVLWLNLGDSYYSGRGKRAEQRRRDPGRPRGWVPTLDRRGRTWAKPKNLLGIPWRVAFALQDDGWTLRNAIIWHKPNAMPESVTDRLSTRYEHLFLFSKSRRYWFDLDPIREHARRRDHRQASPASAARPGKVATGGPRHPARQPPSHRLDQTPTVQAAATPATCGRSPQARSPAPTSPPCHPNSRAAASSQAAPKAAPCSTRSQAPAPH